MFDIDGVYLPPDGVDMIDYLEDTYPTLIERFEDRFKESQLQYFEPGKSL